MSRIEAFPQGCRCEKSSVRACRSLTAFYQVGPVYRDYFEVTGSGSRLTGAAAIATPAPHESLTLSR